MRNQHHLLKFLTSFLCATATCLAQDAAPANHPAAPVALIYLKAVVGQDWQKCSEMLLHGALARKHQDAIKIVKNSSTMPEETAWLASLNLKSIAELEKLTPQQFYVTERSAVHKGLVQPAGSLARQLATIQMTVLSVGTEEGGRFAHVLVRSHRETTDAMVHELTLVSLVRDEADPTKWSVMPDTQLPVAEPLANQK